MSELLNRILVHEGFRATPYKDTLGVLTFGHGITSITEAESIEIVKGRLLANAKYLQQLYPWIDDLPYDIAGVLVEMSYQLGIAGLGKFKKMLAALQAGDYAEAARQGIASRWAEQTPSRANELMNIIRGQV